MNTTTSRHRSKIILSPDSSIQLTDKELSWFVSELIEWREENQKGELWSKPLGRLATKLKSAGIKFPAIEDSRGRNLLTKGFVFLEDPERNFLLLAIQHVLLPDIPVEDMMKRAEVAKRKASTKFRGLGTKEILETTRAYARILGLPVTQKSQEALNSVGGSYLIFRRLYNLPTLVASYMEVFPDKASLYPAEFITVSSAIGATTDEKRVEGIMYAPVGQHKVVYSIGKEADNTQIRSTILKPVPKPAVNNKEESKKDDLIGIRLSIGLNSGEPRAYRIWCSKLTGPEPTGGWRKLALEYAISSKKSSVRLSNWPAFETLHGHTPHEFFVKHVVGFQYILDWLSNPVFTTFRHKKDPQHL